MDELGDGRYRLGRVVDPRRRGGLIQALDTRLGRRVLVQSDPGIAFPGADACGPDSDHPARAPMLDGGEDTGPDGTPWSYTVYPDSDWSPVAGLTRPERRRVRLTVALDTDELLVDPRWLAGDAPPGGRPVLWLPSPSELGARAWSGDPSAFGIVPTLLRREVA